MKPMLCAILLFMSNACFASGFGWHVTLLPWGDFLKETNSVREEVEGLLVTTPGNQKIREYLQRRLDEVIWNHCVSEQPMYTRLTPRYMEFYPVDTLKYAQALQIKRGKKVSFFNSFFEGRPYLRIIPTWSWSNTDPVFVVEPDEVAKWYAELKEFNSLNGHAEEHADLLAHLEAVLLLAKVDRYPGKLGNEYGMKTGLLFCGHN